MKLILAAIDAKYSHSNPALFYLLEAARGLPFDINIEMFSINKGYENIANEIIAKSPDAVAISVYIWNSLHVKKIIPMLRAALPQVKIILGGPEVSHNASSWLAEFPVIDFIIMGAGETAFRTLLEQNIDHSEKIISSANPHFSHIPFSYREEDMEMLENRFIYYESSRGCAFRCSYCLSSRDKGVEYRDIKNVKAELAFLASYSPRYIKFVDRTFNGKKERAKEIWEYIIDNFSTGDTCFHFEIFPEFLQDDDFAVLKYARPGLIQFEAGVQSIHEDTLQAVKRFGNWNEAKTNLRRILDETNIRLHVDMLAGLPFEDMGGIAESFNEIYALRAHYFQAGFLKLLPGTELSARRDEFGIICDELPPYGILKNNWLSRHEVKMFKRVARALDALYNSGKFAEALSFLEEKYSSPFLMFYDIALYMEESGMELKRNNAASFMDDFFKNRKLCV